MLRRVNTRLLFSIATWGEITPENARFIVIKKFFEKFFRRIYDIKNTKKNRKYCMETMDEKIAKALIFRRSRGVDKVIFGCYNEAAPREISAYN